MESYPRWTYVVIFTLLVVVVVLSVRALRKKATEPVAIAPVENSATRPDTPPQAIRPDNNQPTQRDPDNERRIQELTADVEQLRKENEANANHVRELEGKLADTRNELVAVQQKLKAAQKQLARAPAPGVPPARDRTVASAPPAPPPQAAPRRSTEAGQYEVVRDTSLLEKPSSSAREVALVQRGIIVNVISSVGEWYEVRSKYGKPPGYIRREDVIPKSTQSENRDRF